MNELLNDKMRNMITSGVKIELGHIGAIFDNPVNS